MSQITSTNDLQTLTGNGGGGAVSPLNGNITIVGGTGIAVTGNQAAHTITISNTGAEASTFNGDTGTATPLAGVIDIFGAATGSITTSASGNTIDIAVSGTTNHAVQLGDAFGSLSNSNLGTNGQVLIGATGADPAFSTLTSTSGTVSFTAGVNSLDLNVVGGGMAWQTVAVNTSMASNTGYVTAAGAQINLLLPAVSAVGAVVQIVDSGQAGTNSPWRVTQAAGQQIFAALTYATTSGAGGYLEVTAGSTDAQYSSVTLRCIVANTLWVVESASGNINAV